MNFVEWLQFVYDICTSAEPPANWREISLGSNLAIALAYFWIPTVMAIVFRRWRQEIPFPWIWAGFVAFIFACGASHVVHAVHALSEQTPYSALKLSVLVITAVVSLATALAFTIILPKVMRFASPAATRKRLQDAVQAATADLERALEHEKLLLREVHHRVKNNLQVTSSLIGLHMRRAPGEDNAELAALRDRIMAMASVHDQLQDVGARPFSVRHFAETICEKLRLSYGREDVFCTVTGEDFVVSLDHAPAMALILHEVVSNALKHAYPGRPGSLRIELDRNEKEHVVRVVDDGLGLPVNPPAGGIGSKLVAALIVQLDGRADWQPCEEGGTVFRLTVPIAAREEKEPHGELEPVFA